uniref:Uncharacterized protein n=1 Tax=Glossina pallidipes TaxID=7398 RepID=A0A1A9ZU26_GLOPL
MAIPFCEPTAAQSEEVIEQILDQVDAAISNNNENNLPTSSNVNEEDLMAWKLLALIMCKALKNLHQQQPAASNASSTKTASSFRFDENAFKPAKTNIREHFQNTLLLIVQQSCVLCRVGCSGIL